MKNSIKKNVLIIFSFFFGITSFWSCEKDFSGIKKIHQPTINDTTSHDFIWQLDTIGIYPSVLRGIYAIDKTNVWAVGDVYAEVTMLSIGMGSIGS